jgi:hypothetical protein
LRALLEGPHRIDSSRSRSCPLSATGSSKSATGGPHRIGAVRNQKKMMRANGHSALWLVYPKSNVLTAKVRVFMDFLLEHVGQHPVWTGPPA